MPPLLSAPPRVRLSVSHPLHAAESAMLFLSIACNISAIGNAVDKGDPFREVVDQSIEEGKRMEKEYPPGDSAVPGVQGAPLPPAIPPPVVQAPSPPALTGLQFPSELSGDGTSKGGWLTFSDLGGDCTRAVFSVVSATNFTPFEYNPVDSRTSGDV